MPDEAKEEKKDEKKPEAGSMAEAQAALGSLITRLRHLRDQCTQGGDKAGNFRSRLGSAIYDLENAEKGD